jgi:hypothetical protein
MQLLNLQTFSLILSFYLCGSHGSVVHAWTSMPWVTMFLFAVTCLNVSHFSHIKNIGPW